MREKLSRILSFLALLLFPLFPHAHAYDEPFTYPSNWGGTGLMEIPSARVMKKDSYRLGISNVKPYRAYYGAISPLEGLEVHGRIIEFEGISFKGQKTTKDEAVNLKYQFIAEGKYLPAISIGIMDPFGTRLFPSQYFVASKQVYPFDFTLGLGNGRFGKRTVGSQDEDITVELIKDPVTWLRDSQFFGGMQFAPYESLAFMLEYSPILYHKQIRDPAQAKYFRDPVASPFNFGIRYKPSKWSELDLSYQRGNQFGINFSTAFDIGKPLIPIYDPVYRIKKTLIPSDENEQLIEALRISGFSDIAVSKEGDELWIMAQNEKYLYNMKALGTIIRLLADIDLENIYRVHIVLKENGIPLIEFNTTSMDIADLRSGKMTMNEFVRISEFNTAVSEQPDLRGFHKKQYRFDLRPDFQTFLNDPSGYFKYRLGVTGWVSHHPWDGASIIAGLSSYPFNNISTDNDPLSIPVRSDHVYYKQENVSLDRLMFDQIKRLSSELYGKFSAGFLEVQYAGISGEVAMPLFNGRILLGLEGSAVKKRAPDNFFELMDDTARDIFTTAFINTRLNLPEEEIYLDLKTGRFLAGDYGARLTVTKNINGVTLWAWYSITDTSIFNDRYNPGYHDKGIGLSIPIRLFKGSDSRTTHTYLFAPWARDTGQDLDHYSTLFDIIGRNVKIFLDKDKDMLYR